MLRQGVCGTRLCVSKRSGCGALKRNPPKPRTVPVQAGLLPDFKSIEHAAEIGGGLLVLGAIGSRAGGFVGKLAQGATTAGLSAISNIPGVATLGQKRWLILAISILIDGAGMISYVIPGLGEAEDVVGAPVGALLVQALYGSSFMSTLEFAEEILPFTDALPTATICWLLQYTFLGNSVRELLKFRPLIETVVKKGDKEEPAKKK